MTDIFRYAGTFSAPSASKLSEYKKRKEEGTGKVLSPEEAGVRQISGPVQTDKTIMPVSPGLTPGGTTSIGSNTAPTPLAAAETPASVVEGPKKKLRGLGDLRRMQNR